MSNNIDAGPDNVVKIKVIGVGGGGNNAVNSMVRSGVNGVEFIAVNTDKPVLTKSNANLKIQIGEKLTKGQGAGANPEIGKKSAEESRNEIAKVLEDTDMVFITCGMGGGTGTGAAPIVADIAREAGVLTVGVVTKPFGYEGNSRMRQAEEGISNLLGKVDSLLVIPNDRLKLVSETKITMLNAYEIADDVLRQSVSSITEIVQGIGRVNSDFADIKAVMSNSGLAHMGIGSGGGKSKAEDAVRKAVESILMATSIKGARALLVNFTASPDLGLDDVEEAMSLVRDMVDEDATIIFGTDIDETMDDEIRVAIIATKFIDSPQFEDSKPIARAAEPVAAPAPVAKPVEAAPAPVKPAPVAEPVKKPETFEQGPAATTPVPAAGLPEEEDPFDAIAQLFQSK